MGASHLQHSRGRRETWRLTVPHGRLLIGHGSSGGKELRGLHPCISKFFMLVGRRQWHGGQLHVSRMHEGASSRDDAHGLRGLGDELASTLARNNLHHDPEWLSARQGEISGSQMALINTNVSQVQLERSRKNRGRYIPDKEISLSCTYSIPAELIHTLVAPHKQSFFASMRKRK